MEFWQGFCCSSYRGAPSPKQSSMPCDCPFVHTYVCTPREITKKQVSNVFKSNGLKIKVEVNKKTVDFLDVTFNLSSGSYKPYTKPNKKLLHVHRLRNHASALLKNILQNINKRLTDILSTKQVLTLYPLRRTADFSKSANKDSCLCTIYYLKATNQLI